VTARTARLKATDADAIIDNTLAQVGQAIERISLPALSAYGPNGRQLAEQMFEIIHSRVMSFCLSCTCRRTPISSCGQSFAPIFAIKFPG
jgi:hypothetical protein